MYIGNENIFSFTNNPRNTDSNNEVPFTYGVGKIKKKLYSLQGRVL